MRYSEMKSSGVEWIGEVPRHWKVERIKNMATDQGAMFIDGDWINSPDIADTGIRYFTTGNVGQGFFKEQGNGYISEETFQRLNCTMAHGGDLIISRLNEPVGRACVIPDKYQNCIVAVDNVIFRPNKVYNKRYLMYSMSSDRYAEFTLLLARGTTMQRISRTQLGNIFLPVPPLAEQEAIAAYLDEKCAAIDDIIQQAKATVEEYKAWKASVIFEAVTKGLDPDAEMKDSGVEWIGKIPACFNVIKLKYLVSDYKAGPFGSSLITGDLLPHGKILVYTPEHIAQKTTENAKNLYLPDHRKDEMSQFLVEPGDIIFPIVGSLGRSMMITPDMPNGIINQRLAKFKINKDVVDINYFLWVFSRSSFYSTYIELNQRGSIIVNLTKSIIYNMPFVLPELTMQKKISSYLDKKCSEIDNIINEKQKLIDELENYKKSLIFETVTGKRRVY